MPYSNCAGCKTTRAGEQPLLSILDCQFTSGRILLLIALLLQCSTLFQCMCIAVVLLLRLSQVLLQVGDHCQLGPVVMSKKAARAGLSQVALHP